MFHFTVDDVRTNARVAETTPTSGVRRALRLGTCLSGAAAALILMAPSSARAADECGIPVDGIVTCAPAGNPYMTGISYDEAAALPQDLTVQLDQGLAIDTSGTTNNGITLINSSGGVATVSGGDASIETSGMGAKGVFVLSNAENAQGDIDVNVGGVATSGDRAIGIDANANYGGNGGNIHITAGNVSTEGEYAAGVVASAYTGGVTLDLGSVTTTGDNALGIDATSSYGDATVNVGSVETSGLGGRGISAYSEGTTTVTAGNITTTGQGVPFHGDSDGVMAVGTAVDVNISGTVSTSGDYSVGVYAHSNHIQIDDYFQGNQSINVTVGNVVTQGLGSDGIHAVNTNYSGGHISVTVGSVSTAGDYAWGVFADSYHGNVAVDAGTVTTSGDNGTGIIAIANGQPGLDPYAHGFYRLSAFVTLSADNVITTGDNATGILTISAGQTKYSGTSIDVGNVSTSGINSAGIDARSYFPGSSVDINAGTVTTHGDSSDGIDANSAGSITITTNGVSTDGAYSDGIHATIQPSGAQTSAINIAANDVSTTGIGSKGIYANALVPLSDITIEANHVSTSGNYAYAVLALSHSGDIKIDASDITASGIYSGGVAGVSRYGDVSINANGVTVTGPASSGVVALALGGRAVVVAKDIDAYYNAVFVNADSVDITTSGTISGIIAGTARDSLTLHNDAAVTGAISMTLAGGGIPGDLLIDGDGSTTSSYGHGVSALNASGGSISLTQGSVTTTGDGSDGVVASVGNGSPAPGKAPVSPNILVDLQNVTTSGARARAITLNNAAQGGNAVAVVHGTVATSGTSAQGVHAYSANGMAGAQLNAVKTEGDFADAVHLDGKSVLLNVTGPISTQGNLAIGVAAYGGNGGIKIADSGSIATSGIDGTGIRASAPGDITITGSGSITTTGADSVGIQATEVKRHRELYSYVPRSYVPTFGPPHDDPRVKETPVTGSTITIAANAVATAGDRSDGIFASASTGAVKITTNSVVVTGADSVGIFAEDKAVSADSGNTSSAKSTAIELRGYDTAALNVRGLTTSGSGDAVQLQGSNVTLTVAAGGNIHGVTNGVVIDATPHVTPVVTYWGHVPNYNYYAPVQPAPPANPAPGKVTVANGGTIVGGTGYAVQVSNGVANISNSGRIDGAVKLGANGDVVTNSGEFNATKDSDFGTGTDLFTNSGTVRVMTAAAANVSFLGLEKFDNAGGLIDLRNGHAGDVLTLTGNFVGSGGARLALDVKGTMADNLVVQGAATGKTNVVLANLGALQATLTGATTITLIKVGAGSATDAFSVATPNIGFIQYGLTYDAANRFFNLVGTAGSGVYRGLKIGEGAASAWNQSADVWTSHMTELRDADNAGPERRLWGQLHGQVDNRDEDRNVAVVGGTALRYDLGYKQDHRGAQLGVDLGNGGALTWGVTGGYLSSKLKYDGADEKVKYGVVNVGLYGSYKSGPFFANGLLKYDRYSIEAESTALGYSDKFKARGYGARLEAGVRLDMSGLFVEPVASLAWQKTKIDDLKALGQLLDFDSQAGLRGKIGARFGGRHALGSGSALVFYGGANLVHEFLGEDGLTLFSGGTSEHVDNERIKSYGQGLLGLNFVSAGKFSGFAEGNANLGGSYKGGGGRVGLRIKL
jgi:fibronectin-binding autotransporter adhesin